MAQTQSLTADFIKSEAADRIKWQEISHNAKSHVSVFTETENFFAQDKIIREEAVFLAIDELLKNKPSLRSVKRAVVRRFCERKVNAADLGTVKIRREGKKIIISRTQKEYFERGVSRLLYVR